MAATRGKAKTISFSQSGSLVEGNREGESWNFIYEASIVKHPGYEIGDRVQLPDGRVFRYGKSGAACWSGRGCKFDNAIPATGIDYVLLTENAPKGQAWIKTTATVDQVEDDLRGGHALFKLLNASNDSALQARLITGNSAASAAGEITIYLDGGLSAALTTLSYIICMPSPWNSLSHTTEYLKSHAGLPAVYVDAADKYFWVQTWGMCWCAMQTDDAGVTAYARQLVFRNDGSMGIHDPADVIEKYGQHAGFILDDNTLQNGATKVMLQICP